MEVGVKSGVGTIHQFLWTVDSFGLKIESRFSRYPKSGIWIDYRLKESWIVPNLVNSDGDGWWCYLAVVLVKQLRTAVTRMCHTWKSRGGGGEWRRDRLGVMWWWWWWWWMAVSWCCPSPGSHLSAFASQKCPVLTTFSARALRCWARRRWDLSIFALFNLTAEQKSSNS